MTVKESLERWLDAILAFDKSRLEKSLSIFQKLKDTSKIRFNVGIVAQRLRKYDEAIEAFTCAIRMDSFFAAAYFQRAALLFYNNDIEGALEDYQSCFENLRGNTHINYSQLGLEYVLHECHVVFNIALCMIALHDYNNGLKYVDQALQASQNASISPDVSKIDEAFRKGYDFDGMAPYEIPISLIFRPKIDYAKNAKTVDYLGKSEIIAGSNKSDNFNGFSGRQQKELTLGRDYRKQNITKGFSDDDIKASTFKVDSISRRPSNSSSSMGRPSYESSTTGRPSKESTSLGRHPKKSSSMERPSKESTSTKRHYNASTSLGRHPYEPTSLNRPYEITSSLPRSSVIDTSLTSLTSLGKSFIRRCSTLASQTNPVSKLIPIPISKMTQKNLEFKDSDGYENGNGGEHEDQESSNEDKIQVKAHFNGCRIVSIPLDSTFDMLSSEICTEFCNPDLLLKFFDETGRKLIMSNDNDFAEALDLAQGENVLEVWCFLPHTNTKSD